MVFENMCLALLKMISFVWCPEYCNKFYIRIWLDMNSQSHKTHMYEYTDTQFQLLGDEVFIRVNIF